MVSIGPNLDIVCNVDMSLIIPCTKDFVVKGEKMFHFASSTWFLMFSI